MVLVIWSLILRISVSISPQFFKYLWIDFISTPAFSAYTSNAWEGQGITRKTSRAIEQKNLNCVFQVHLQWLQNLKFIFLGPIPENRMRPESIVWFASDDNCHLCGALKWYRGVIWSRCSAQDWFPGPQRWSATPTTCDIPLSLGSLH